MKTTKKGKAAAIDGILLLDKPLGLSSNAALQQVRQLFGAFKAGHSGSLDPLASGMLPICLGEATKLSSVLLDARKSYRFVVQLGSRTATGDLEGEIVEQCAVPTLTEQSVQGVLASFTGSRMQVPPMYSALKHEGQRLYDLARRGENVPREARPIELFEMTLEDFDVDTFTVRTVCSKGTYIRVLAEDIAAALGTCGHVTLLRRLWVGPFFEREMLTLETLAAVAAKKGGLDQYLLPVDQGVLNWPRIDLNEEQALRLLQGQKLRSSRPWGHRGSVRVYGPERFLGLADVDEAGFLIPRRLIATLQGSE